MVGLGLNTKVQLVLRWGLPVGLAGEEHNMHTQASFEHICLLLPPSLLRVLDLI